MTGLWIVLAHLLGDYVLQSNWMATSKTQRWWPAVAHGITYTIPYVFITQSLTALSVIAGTHILIDRFRLARHVVWFKNLVGPASSRSGHTPTGYPQGTPDWLAFWLMIAVDNTLHLLINGLAVVWL